MSYHLLDVVVETVGSFNKQITPPNAALVGGLA